MYNHNNKDRLGFEPSTYTLRATSEPIIYRGEEGSGVVSLHNFKRVVI